MQMISALSELAIPHFTSASIFAATEAKQQHVFNHHLKQLLVGDSWEHAALCFSRLSCFLAHSGHCYVAVDDIGAWYVLVSA